MFHLNPSTIPQKEHKLGIEDMFAYRTTKYGSIEEAEWEQPLPSSCDVSSNISREATSCKTTKQQQQQSESAASSVKYQPMLVNPRSNMEMHGPQLELMKPESIVMSPDC